MSRRGASVASVYLAIAIVTAAIGVAPLVLALTGRSVSLPDVALDADAVRGTAAALGVLVVGIGLLNMAYATALILASRSAWSGAVVSSGLTATALFVTTLGLIFQRGAGALPSADAAALGTALMAIAYGSVCGLIAARGTRGG